MRVRRWLYGLAAGLMLGAGPLTVFGYQEPASPPLPDFDKRRDLLQAEAAPKAAREAAAAKLKERVRNARVHFDRLSGSPKWIVSLDDFLSGPNGPGGDPNDAVKAFVKEHRDLFGHGPEALEAARIKRSWHDSKSGLRTTVWEQELDGVPVFESVFVAHTGRGGELAAVSSQFVPSLLAAADKGNPNWRAASKAPKISARRAVVESGKNLGVALREEEIEEEPGPDPRAKHFKGARLKGGSRAQLWWVPLNEDAMRLAWEVHLTRQPEGDLYRIFIDCETGDVLVRHCRTFYLEDASYRVFTTASPAPMSPGPPIPSTNQPPPASRSLVTLPAVSTIASPVGWISPGENETRGNNVDAHLDRDADDKADLPRPHGAPHRVFDFPLDLSQHPQNHGDASTVQLFYWCNWMHDRLYELGFTESAGNFQKDNFGRGGAENDALLAQAQDGSGVNNARFFQAPDGYPGRIEMFLFDGPEPDRDASLDAEIVLHEYTHGLTDRLVGGGAGIFQWVTYGLAEGWSDFYALAMLNDPALDVDGVYTEGGYSTRHLIGLEENHYFGIRRYPYTTDMSKNPLTFKDVDPAQISAYPDVPRSPIQIFNPARAGDPHRVGEVWCNTLWQARANLIRKHGPTAGNELVLQLVTDGLKLSPPNPTFLQARDAILLADRVLTGGANQLELWTAFAKRGMGLQASEPPNFTTEGVRESFDRPDTLLVTPFNPVVFSGPAGGPFTPHCRSLALSNSTAEPLTWSADDAGPYLLLSGSSGTLPPNGMATMSLCPSPLSSGLALGTYSMSLSFSNHLSGAIQRRDVQLRVQEFAAMPFREDFEARELGPFWHVTGTPLARATLTTNLGPQSGQQHLILQSAASGFLARNEVTLGVDLAGYTNVVLRLWAKEFQDEPDGPPPTPFYDGADFDGIAISADGYVWYEAVGLRRLRDDYSEIIVNLDEVIRRHGLAYSDAFRIRLNQTDNGLIPSDGIALDSIRIDGIAPRRFTVALPEGLKESEGMLSGAAEITLPAPVSSDVTVELTSSDPNVAVVQDSVVLRAGSDHAPFDMVLLDDDLLEGPQRVTIRATAPGYLTGEAILTVMDDETATLTLEVVPSVTEGWGTIGGIAQVRVSPTPQLDLALELKSSDTEVIRVPAAVVIPAGTNAAPFNVEVLDDGAIDGAQTVTLTAKLNENSVALATITVMDNESTNLFLSVPHLLNEFGTLLQNAGIVRIAGTLPTNLTVTLASTAPNVVRTPELVTILAGKTSANFNLTVSEDAAITNVPQISILAQASQFGSTSAALRVLDNDAAPVPYAPSPEPYAATSHKGVQLAWSLGTPELVVSGDFESGSGNWHIDTTGGGDVVFNDGSLNPPGPEPATPPYSGRFSVLIQPSSPGRRVLYQDVTIPLYFDSAVLSWTDRIRNHASTFSEEHFFRVEVRSPDGIPLGVAFSTEPGYPALNDWHERSFDLSNFRGTTVRIMFIEEDSLGFLNVHLDNVRVFLSSPGPATSEVYFGTTPNLGSQHLQGVTTSTSFNLPQLALDSPYYWRIIARRGESRSAGPIWQFRTRGIGALDHFRWAAFGQTQVLNEPFPVDIAAQDSQENIVPSFSRSVHLGALQKHPPEPVQVLTFSGYSGREYRAMLAGISTFFTNYIENTITSGDASVLEAQLAGKDVLIVPEQAAAPAGALTALARAWSPVVSNFVHQGGVVIVCSYLRDEHQILNESGLMQLTRILPFASGTLKVTANHSLVQDVPPMFQAINLSAYSSLNGLAVVEMVQTNAAVVLTRAVGNGQVVMIGYDFSENRTPFDRIAANAVRLAERELIIPIDVWPPLTGYFDEGSWLGSVAVAGVGSNIVLVAQDSEGHHGTSAPFTVVAPGDLSAELTDLAEPVFVGSNIVYRLTLRHTAPGAAQNVHVSAPVPPEMSFVSAIPSTGACVLSNQTILCELGSMTGDAEATVMIELTANTAGRLEFSAEVSSTTDESYTPNNRASAQTRVLFPSVYIGDALANEGDAVVSALTFQVELRPAVRQPVTLNYTSSNFTAIAGIDYEARSGTITFAPGITNQTIAVPVLPDRVYEGLEVFTVHVSQISNAIPGKVTASGIIFEDDAQPALSIEDATAVEGALGTITQAVFAVKLSTNAGIAVTADFATVNGTAIASQDYDAISGSVTFPPGVTSTNIAVPILGDAASETNETLFVRLTSPINATLDRGEATGLIIDDDIGKIERFAWSAIGSPQIYSFPFPVTVTAQDSLGNTASGFTGPAKLAGWTANRYIGIPLGSDSWEFPMGTYFHDQRLQAIYLASEVGEASRITALSLRITTMPSQPLQRWTLRMKHTSASTFTEPLWEQGWTQVFQNLEIVTSNGWATFQFNEPFDYNGVENLLVDFSFNNTTFSSDGQCLFTPTAEHRSLYFRTDSGFGDPLSWAGSEPPAALARRVPTALFLVEKTVAITPKLTGAFTNGVWAGNITVNEVVENMSVRAEDGHNHFGSANLFSVTAIDDVAISAVDTPDPVRVGDLITYTYLVTNTGPSSASNLIVSNQLPPTVTFMSANPSQGTCQFDNGILRCSLGTVSGSNTAAVAVVVVAGQVGFVTNHVSVSRGEPDTYLGNNSAQSVTRVNPLAVLLTDTSITEATGTLTNLIFNVRLSSTNADPVQIEYFTSNGSATNNIDYTGRSGVLTFAPGVTNLSVAVPIIGDNSDEPTETLFLNVTNPVNASIVQNRATGTILDDDPPPTLIAEPLSIVEGNSGVITMAFPMRLSAPSEHLISFGLASSNGTATAGQDYSPANLTFLIPPRLTNRLFNLNVLGERVVEPDETFHLHFSRPVNLTIATNRTQGTIINDDGLPGVLEYFAWSPTPAPARVNQSFPASLTARDFYGALVSNYTGSVILGGRVGRPDIAVGTGNSQLRFPMTAGQHDARMQVIYLAPELDGPRRLLGLSLDVVVPPGQALNHWTIRLRHTAITNYTSFSGWETNGWMTVYRTNQTVDSPGWISFPFQTPFEYDGSNSLMVDFSFDNTFFTVDGLCRFNLTNQFRTIGGFSDSANGDPLSWLGYVPSTQIHSGIPVIRFTSGFPVPITPSTSEAFTNGTWSGHITVLQPATNMFLFADDGLSHTGLTDLFNAESTPDSDNDGLLDTWEVAYFGSIGAQPNADPDGDGMSNLEEQAAGTHPLDPANVLAISRIRTDASGVRLAFQAVAGKRYRLERTANLSGPWNTALDDISGPTGLLEITDSDPSLATAFYRIRLVP